jgi:hypothetical protein
MISRPEPRYNTRLRVRVRGVDAFGHPFQQDAYTRDISRRGARLDGTPCVVDTATVIEVQHRGRRARFRVVWIGGYGTALHAQAGLQCLEPDENIWGSLPAHSAPVTALP